jgi:hypothetical protein
MQTLSHCATATCRAPADTAYAFLADPAQLGTWALGCWEASPVGDGVVSGTSLFDGSTTSVRVDGDPERLAADFAVGSDPDALVHRISARVVPGAGLGYDEGCLVTLLAWRPAAMDDERWARLTASHETEILLLRGRIEGRV